MKRKKDPRKIVQLLVWKNRLVALATTGEVFLYAEGELEDGTDAWEPLTDLREDTIVQGDDDEDEDEDG